MEGEGGEGDESLWKERWASIGTQGEGEECQDESRESGAAEDTTGWLRAKGEEGGEEPSSEEEEEEKEEEATEDGALEEAKCEELERLQEEKLGEGEWKEEDLYDWVQEEEKVTERTTEGGP